KIFENNTRPREATLARSQSDSCKIKSDPGLHQENPYKFIIAGAVALRQGKTCFSAGPGVQPTTPAKMPGKRQACAETLPHGDTTRSHSPCTRGQLRCRSPIRL